MTILTLPFDDSSRISVIPSTTLSRTKWAILVTKLALLTWYGISLIMICFLPECSFSLISARERITIDPVPVSYASLIPERPKIIAPVEKSGPYK